MLYTEIMTQNKDFQLCYRKGKSVVSQNVILYARVNRLPVNRLGITTSKKVGNAVCRSRARRLIRQAWRENELLAPVGLDIVIVARAGITEIKSDVLSRYLRKYGMPALHQIYQGGQPQPKRGEKKS
ncbi:MAG: ribonuclease P protein component [Oscillospiraceae bacterium]|nr:ribonuclease P protein component [Oscillospiraceae bacterium]